MSTPPYRRSVHRRGTPLGGGAGCSTCDYDAVRLKITNSIRSMLHPQIRALEAFGVFDQN